MKKELTLLFVLVVLATVASCAQIMALTAGAAEKAGVAIAEYCTLPAESRAQFRAQVAKSAAPHSAQINCATP